ncbi:MAG: HprK-related kinase A [Alphaproteobacteria bacterium]
MIVDSLTSGDFVARATTEGVTIRTGPFVNRILTAPPELARVVHFLYGDFPLVEDAPADFDVRVELAHGIRRLVRPTIAFFADGRAPFHPFPRRLSLPLLEWGLNWCIYGQPQRYLVFHAAAVERRGAALILPGDSGSGKSTLCAGLVARGWRLLSDELALLDLDTRTLIPIARPVSLKNESIEVMQAFAPDARLGPEFADTRKGRLKHMRPPADSVRRTAEPARPAWIAFPAFKPGAGNALAAVPKAEALMRVAEHALNRGPFGIPGFEAVAWLAESCGCYDLVYSSLDATVAAFERLSEAGAAP